MKTNNILTSIVLFSVLILWSCGNGTATKPVVKTASEDEKTTVAAQEPVVSVGKETALLLSDLKENGDYVNSKAYPSLIKASIVNESLGKNLLIVDIRPAKEFTAGHIKGAVNKSFQDLPSYFETGIKPFEYDKIVIVSEDGQESSYTTCLLRLMGYGNVYSMRWGMSAWNNKYASEGWLKGVSGKYESKLETTVNERPAATKMPELNTGLASGQEIGTARIKKLFAEGTANLFVSSDQVFADPSSYYIINLERKDKYEDGHIPGSVRYKPEGTLGYISEMGSIPSDKQVVVYCGTGHNSGFATAYLRVLGFDAHTLRYGNNGFMHDKMVKQKALLSWLPFSSDDVNNFDVVK
jgi:rhodanese-related sulfurtransferase